LIWQSIFLLNAAPTLRATNLTRRHQPYEPQILRATNLTRLGVVYGEALPIVICSSVCACVHKHTISLFLSRSCSCARALSLSLSFSLALSLSLSKVLVGSCWMSPSTISYILYCISYIFLTRVVGSCWMSSSTAPRPKRPCLPTQPRPSLAPPPVNFAFFFCFSDLVYTKYFCEHARWERSPELDPRP